MITIGKDENFAGIRSMSATLLLRCSYGALCGGGSLLKALRMCCHKSAFGAGYIQ